MKQPSFSLRPLAGAILLMLVGTSSSAFAQAQNTTTSFLYDAVGNVRQITDPLGHVTTQQYDSLNRLVTRIDPNLGNTQYGYDGLDQLIGVTDPRNLVTRYTIDGLGNRTALASPDSGTGRQTYDVAGNLKTSTDARGKTTTYTYDALNRITNIAYADGTATAYEYDGGTSGAANAKGHLTKMTDESGQTTYTYDGFGRLSSKTQTIGSGSAARSFPVSYTWGDSGNATGKLVALTYPSGNQLILAYDSVGRINRMTLHPTNGAGGTDSSTSIDLLTDIGYAPFGPVQRWTWGNSSDIAGNTYARGIDLDGRITSYPLGNLLANGTNRTLTYDAASRINGTSHSGLGTGANAPSNSDQSYSYDNLNRLTGFSALATSQSYQYDATGNRTQAMLGTTPYTYTVDAASNKLTAVSAPAVQGKSDTYDAAGNLLGDGSHTYVYSDRGRMSSATSGSNLTRYAYNGLGQRVSKSGSSTLISTGANYFVYDEAGRLLGEYDGNGLLLEETLYLGDMPVALWNKEIRMSGGRSIAAGVYYIYADHLNTPRVITRPSDNSMMWRWDNGDAFGVQQPNSNPSGWGPFLYNLRYPGQYFDKETNLFYNYFRDYDPQTGRYIESDPIGLRTGPNTYGYVRGNPISRFDPLGLYDLSPTGPYLPSNPPYPPLKPEPGLQPVCIECLFIPLARVANTIANMCKANDSSTSAYPPNRGFDGTPQTTTLPPGTIIDRYGSPNGTFASPAGTPFPARSLPESSANAPLTTYEVVQPIEVQAGPATPWYGQPGGGMQYELPNSVQQLLNSGHLR